MKLKAENTDDESWKKRLNDEDEYWEYWLAFLGNCCWSNMLSILKKINLTSNETGLLSPFLDVYLSSKKMPKFSPYFFVVTFQEQ